MLNSEAKETKEANGFYAIILRTKTGLQVLRSRIVEPAAKRRGWKAFKHLDEPYELELFATRELAQAFWKLARTPRGKRKNPWLATLEVSKVATRFLDFPQIEALLRKLRNICNLLVPSGFVALGERQEKEKDKEKQNEKENKKPRKGKWGTVTFRSWRDETADLNDPWRFHKTVLRNLRYIFRVSCVGELVLEYILKEFLCCPSNNCENYIYCNPWGRSDGDKPPCMKFLSADFSPTLSCGLRRTYLFTFSFLSKVCKWEISQLTVEGVVPTTFGLRLYCCNFGIWKQIGEKTIQTRTGDLPHHFSFPALEKLAIVVNQSGKMDEKESMKVDLHWITVNPKWTCVWEPVQTFAAEKRQPLWSTFHLTPENLTYLSLYPDRFPELLSLHKLPLPNGKGEKAEKAEKARTFGFLPPESPSLLRSRLNEKDLCVEQWFLLPVPYDDRSDLASGRDRDDLEEGQEEELGTECYVVIRTSNKAGDTLYVTEVFHILVFPIEKQRKPVIFQNACVQTDSTNRLVSLDGTPLLLTAAKSGGKISGCSSFRTPEPQKAFPIFLPDLAYPYEIGS